MMACASWGPQGFRGKDLGWGVSGEGDLWICLYLREGKVLEFQLVLYRIRLVFPRKCPLEVAISLEKTSKLRALPSLWHSVLGRRQWDREQRMGESHSFRWQETTLKLSAAPGARGLTGFHLCLRTQPAHGWAMPRGWTTIPYVCIMKAYFLWVTIRNTPQKSHL